MYTRTVVLRVSQAVEGNRAGRREGRRERTRFARRRGASKGSVGECLSAASGLADRTRR